MTTATTAAPGRFAMPRSRGAASGLALILLGLWGGLVPFIGHYFNLVIGSDRAWDFTAGRFWLNVLPAAATIFGGLLLMRSANRATASFGAWAAIAGGAWFVVGPVVSMLWNDGQPQTGAPLGGPNRQVVEWLTYHYALGAAIIAIAGIALGRVSTRSVRDVERLTTAHDVDGDGVDDRTKRGGRFSRRRRKEPEPAVAEDRPAGRFSRRHRKEPEPAVAEDRPADDRTTAMRM